MDTIAQGFLPPGRIELAVEPDFNLGALTVRPSRREVEAGAVRRVLQRRVMQVLVALATSRSEVVSQQELIARCWGGLSVSEDAIGRCVAQLRRLADNWPEPLIEIRTIVGVGYRLDATFADPTVASKPPRATRPTVAVLPFANLSPDPDQAYFADGMVEEITASLARFTTFHVVSAGAGIVVDGRNLSPREASRQLGVDYLVDGSVRRDGDRVRITAHLVEARSGREIWAERLDDAGGDVFAIQDRVAERMAGAVEPIVEDVRMASASQRLSPDLDSYDLYLRSLPPFRRSQKASMLEAIDFLERALALDPDFALALGHSVVCHRQVVDHDWSANPDIFRQRGLEYAERALVAAARDARVVAHVAAGVSGLDDTLDRALTLANEAVALNPVSSFARLIAGSVELRAGEPDRAARHLEHSLRLDPISNMSGFARMYLASARFQQRRFEEALTLFRTTTLRLPLSHAILASIYGHLGQLDAAQQSLATFEDLEAGPISKFAKIWFPAETYRSLFLGGLALAAAAPASAASQARPPEKPRLQRQGQARAARR